MVVGPSTRCVRGRLYRRWPTSRCSVCVVQPVGEGLLALSGAAGLTAGGDAGRRRRPSVGRKAASPAPATRPAEPLGRVRKSSQARIVGRNGDRYDYLAEKVKG